MRKRNYYLVVLVFVTFFVMSLVTNILGALIPDIRASFALSLTLAAFLPFAFFIAYGFMSVPAGLLIEAFGEKRVMMGGFLTSLTGSLLFALFPTYVMAVAALFIIGTGIAILQVAVNPLLRTTGGEEHFAFNSVLAQLFFGGASFLSPQLYSYLVLNLGAGETDRNLLLAVLSRLIPEELPWISLYWVFCAALGIMMVVVLVSRFPKVELAEDERMGGLDTFRHLLRNRIVLLYALGIFCYVGSEQGTANWISQFLATYHGYDPQTVGANTVSMFWGLMVVGCILGMILLKILDSRVVIIGFTSAAMLSLTVALLGSGPVATVAFPLVGFFASVMWSVIISLALNSVEEHHGSFTGILCTAIIGGAVVPVIVGAIGDAAGLRTGMLFLYVTFGYVLSIGFWARPLITNKTISFRRSGGTD
jgi:MFS transporter, FHS family, L-fucose permease